MGLSGLFLPKRNLFFRLCFRRKLGTRNSLALGGMQQCYFIAAVWTFASIGFADEWTSTQSLLLQNQTFPTVFLCQHHQSSIDPSVVKRNLESGVYNASSTATRSDAGSRIRIISPYGYISDGPGNYSSDMKCTWLLEAPNGGEIHLIITEFATECNWDHLYIWDGNSVQSPLLGSFSGDLLEAVQRHDILPETSANDQQPVLHLVARSGYALVHFYSDAAYSNTGFNISFRICDKKNEQSCLWHSPWSKAAKVNDSKSSSFNNASMPKADSSNLDSSRVLPISSANNPSASVFGCSKYFPCYNGGACDLPTGECVCRFNATENNSSLPLVDQLPHEPTHDKYPWGVDCSLRGYWQSVYAPEPISGWIEMPSREGALLSPFSLNAAVQSSELRRSSATLSAASLLSTKTSAGGLNSAAAGAAAVDSAPPPSASLAVAQRDNEVILIPGETFSKLKPLSRIYKFNLSTGRWRTLDSQTRNNPESRYGHSAVWYERQNGIYIYGGVVNGTKVVGELWLWASDLDMFVLVETRSCAAPSTTSAAQLTPIATSSADKAGDAAGLSNRDLVKKEPIGKLRSDGGNYIMPKTTQAVGDDEVSVSKLPSSSGASVSNKLQPTPSTNTSTESSSLQDAISALRRSAISSSSTTTGDVFTVQLFTQLLAASRGAAGVAKFGLNPNAVVGPGAALLGYTSECAQPIPSTGHTAHIVNEKMLIFFGYGGSEHGLLPYVQEFDLATRTWRIIQPLGAIVKGTYGHASVYDPLTKHVYISGGALQISIRVSSVSQRLLSFDPSTHVLTILKASPSARVLHAGVATNDGLLLFFGGNPQVSGGNTCFSDAVWAYDTTCNVWTSVNSTTPYFTGVGSVARYGHAAVWYKRQAFLFGGFRGLLLNDVVRLVLPSCAAFGSTTNDTVLSQKLCRDSIKFGAKCFWDSHLKSCLPTSVLVHAANDAETAGSSTTPSNTLRGRSRTDGSRENDVAQLDNEFEHLPHNAAEVAGETGSNNVAGDSCPVLLSNSGGPAGAGATSSAVKIDLFDAKSECERLENCHNCLANKFGCHWCPLASRCTTLPCRMYTPVDAPGTPVPGSSGGGPIAIALAGGGTSKVSSDVAGGDALLLSPLFSNSTIDVAAGTAVVADAAQQQHAIIQPVPVTSNTEITSIAMCPSGVADRCRLQSVCAACNADSNDPLCVWSAAGKTTNLCTPRSPAVDAWHLLTKLSDKQFASKTGGSGSGIQQRLIPAASVSSKSARAQAAKSTTFGGAVGSFLHNVHSNVSTSPPSSNATKQPQSISTHGTLSTVDAALLEHFEQAAEQLLLSTASVSLDCDTPCDARSSCAECVMHASSCMWCASEQRCLDSSMYLMTFPYGQCKEWSTMLKKCDTMLKCEQLRSCDTCLANPECGWCDDGSFTGLGTCQSGSTLAPHNVSQCPSSRWHFVNCPKCNCNGHSVCTAGEGNVCGRCANHTAGPQCDTCEAGYFGDPRNGGDCKQCDCPTELSSGCDSTTGACSCIVKGLKGHRCDRCDDHYVGDPQSNDTSLDATCFYRLANGFQFTFNMSKPEDANYRQLNMANFPNDLDLDLRFAIACSNYSIVNVTVRSLASEQDAVLIENLECSNFTENERIFTSTSNYPIGDKNTTFLVWIRMYHMPLVVKVSFVQVPALDLIQFFLVFSVCFIILLVFVGAGYKIKQRYDFYRRRQRMVVELEALAKRPYPAAYLELAAPRMLASCSPGTLPLLPATTMTAQVERHSPPPIAAPAASSSSSSTGGLLRYGRFARSKQPAAAAAAAASINTSTSPTAAPHYPKYIEDAFSMVITKEAAAAAQNKSKILQASTTASSSSAASSEGTVMKTGNAASLVPTHVVPLSLEPLGSAVGGDKHAVLSVVILLPHDPNTGYTPRDAAPFAIGTTMCTLASGATRKALFSSHLPKTGLGTSTALNGVRFFKRRPRSQQRSGRTAARPPTASGATSSGVGNVRTPSASVEHRSSISGSGNNNAYNTRTVVQHVTVRNRNSTNSNNNDTVIDIVLQPARIASSSNALRHSQQPSSSHA